MTRTRKRKVSDSDFTNKPEFGSCLISGLSHFFETSKYLNGAGARRSTIPRDGRFEESPRSCPTKSFLAQSPLKTPLRALNPWEALNRSEPRRSPSVPRFPSSWQAFSGRGARPSCAAFHVSSFPFDAFETLSWPLPSPVLVTKCGE